MKVKCSSVISKLTAFFLFPLILICLLTVARLLNPNEYVQSTIFPQETFTHTFQAHCENWKIRKGKEGRGGDGRDSWQQFCSSERRAREVKVKGHQGRFTRVSQLAQTSGELLGSICPLRCIPPSTLYNTNCDISILTPVKHFPTLNHG